MMFYSDKSLHSKLTISSMTSLEEDHLRWILKMTSWDLCGTKNGKKTWWIWRKTSILNKSRTDKHINKMLFIITKTELKAKRQWQTKRKLLMEKLLNKRLRNSCYQLELDKLPRLLKTATRSKPKSGNWKREKKLQNNSLTEFSSRVYADLFKCILLIQ